MCTKRKRKLKEWYFSLGHTRCHYCCTQLNYAPGFRNSATIEHIIPKSLGGTLARANSLVVCLECNTKRADKDFMGFITGSKFPRQGWLKEKLKKAEGFYG